MIAFVKKLFGVLKKLWHGRGMTIVTEETVSEFQDNNTRQIEMPDGSMRDVRMTPELWNSLEFLQELDGVTPAEVAGFALEEMTLQDVTFERAFRGIVAHLANRWTP